MEIAEARQPVTVRGICYLLMKVYGLIPSMEKKHTNRIGTHVREVRESDCMPWEWIVDETRTTRTYRAGFDDLAEYVMYKAMKNYRRDYGNHQPHRIEVWSEKSMVGGVLEPALRDWCVDFRNMRGYTSVTNAHDLAILTSHSNKPFVALYVGDWDPLGLHMSEVDMPWRLGQYGGELDLCRIALTPHHTASSEGLLLEAKQKDPRYRWYRSRCETDRFWELDGLDPPILRDRVHQAISDLVDHDAWDHCMLTEQGERESLTEILGGMCERVAALLSISVEDKASTVLKIEGGNDS
jgi:hypothetical protein